VGSADGEVGKSNWKLRLCVGLLPTNPMKTRQTAKKAGGLNQKKKKGDPPRGRQTYWPWFI